MTQITSQEVLSFLKDNPNFFEETPEALELLAQATSSITEDKTVVDFQKKLVEKLRKDHAEAIETQNMLVEYSRANLNNQNAVHESILHLLDATSFEEFIHTITSDLSITLGVDVISLCVESESVGTIPTRYLSGVRIFKKGDVDYLIGDNSSVLQSDIQGNNYIFGEASGLVKSHALLRLAIHPKVPQGILAFGSRDPQGFGEDQAIDQVSFLARVIERCIRAWLNLPS